MGDNSVSRWTISGLSSEGRLYFDASPLGTPGLIQPLSQEGTYKLIGFVDQLAVHFTQVGNPDSSKTQMAKCSTTVMS